MSHEKLIILACVVVMSLGQVLFKQVAINYNKVGTILDISVIGLLFLVGFMYLVSSGLWVWALRSVAISNAYPYFAVGFIFVPLLGVWLFGESLALRHGLGIVLIAFGVALMSNSQ